MRVPAAAATFFYADLLVAIHKQPLEGIPDDLLADVVFDEVLAHIKCPLARTLAKQEPA